MKKMAWTDVLYWLAVPLVNRQGVNIGVLQLSDKYDGEFTQQDEYVALELAQLASSAVENASLFEQIIELNASLLPALVDGSAARNLTGRAHGSQRRELLATLIHELTHLYDRARLWPEAQRHIAAELHLPSSDSIVFAPNTYTCFTYWHWSSDTAGRHQ